jgi:CO/xanthine dehydrogenase Mo-binding subunit
MTKRALRALRECGFTRRYFLKGVGALVVGFHSGVGTAGASVPRRNVAVDQVDSWVAIAADGSVTVYSGKCDFGQGFATVQYQLAADELSVPLDQVQLIYCDTALTPDQGTTDGSQSDPTEFDPSGLRQALATARQALFQMASQLFQVLPDQLAVQTGVISVMGDASRQVSYGQLIGGSLFQLAVDASATPKDPSQYTVLGTSVPRVDLPVKMTGQFEYVQSVRLPGMLHGKVVRPPAAGAKVINVDANSVQGMPGNIQVVVKNDFVGVVADSEWEALQAAKALAVTWSDGLAVHDQQDLYNYMRQQPSRDAYTVSSGDVDAMLQQRSQLIRATYLYPY